MSGREPHWFEPVADHLGAAYLRYSFTKGTAQEVAFLVDELGLDSGQPCARRRLWAGAPRPCARRARSIEVVGIDLSWRFVSLASLRRRVAPSRKPTLASSRCVPDSFDVAISLCQGAFGLLGRPGQRRRRGPATCSARWSPRCVLAGASSLSAFSSYFQVRHLDDAGAVRRRTRRAARAHRGPRRGRPSRSRSSCGRRASRPASSA